MEARAREALEALISAHAEMLPLTCDDGSTVWATNVTRLVDALDMNDSSVLRSSSSGAILVVKKHAFKQGIDLPPLFKLANVPRGLLYATDEFTSWVKSAQLDGIAFSAPR